MDHGSIIREGNTGNDRADHFLALARHGTTVSRERIAVIASLHGQINDAIAAAHETAVLSANIAGEIAIARSRIALFAEITLAVSAGVAEEATRRGIAAIRKRGRVEARLALFSQCSLEDAVATRSELEKTLLRTSIAAFLIAIVAFLARIKDTVTTERTCGDHRNDLLAPPFSASARRTLGISLTELWFYGQAFPLHAICIGRTLGIGEANDLRYARLIASVSGYLIAVIAHFSIFHHAVATEWKSRDQVLFGNTGRRATVSIDYISIIAKLSDMHDAIAADAI